MTYQNPGVDALRQVHGQMTAPMRPLLPLGEAAKQLGICTQSLHKLIKDGTIHAIQVGATGNCLRVPIAEIEKWRTGSYGPRTNS